VKIGCMDASANESTVDVTIRVPHDQEH